MPSFDNLLDSIPEDLRKDLTDRDVVGLAGYYLRKVEEEYPFATKQIREVVEPSLRPIPIESLTTYPSQLKDKGYFQRIGSQWDLTKDGLDYYGNMVSLTSATDKPRDDDDLFISVDHPYDDFYAPCRGYQPKLPVPHLRWCNDPRTETVGEFTYRVSPTSPGNKRSLEYILYSRAGAVPAVLGTHRQFQRAP